MSAPTITAFQVDSVDAGLVTVSGHVSDEYPESVQVYFSGVVDGTTWANSSGNFTYTGVACILGEIVAQAVDNQLRYSNEVEVEFTSNAPTIHSVSVTYNGGTSVTISGEVTDEDPEGLYVQFTGAAWGYAIVDANGHFSGTVADAELGTVEVKTGDWFGQPAATQYEQITSDVPEISNFTVLITPGNTLVVEGDVIDEDPQGLTVEIHWLNTLYYVTVNSQGHFSWQIGLDEGDEGFVGAMTWDWWGQFSEAVENLADPT